MKPTITYDDYLFKGELLFFPILCCVKGNKIPAFIFNIMKRLCVKNQYNRMFYGGIFFHAQHLFNVYAKVYAGG
jgi:hypothetical protein